MSPKPRPSAETTRPHIRMLAPLEEPPKNIGSLKLGSFSDASLASALSAPSATAATAAHRIQGKRATRDDMRRLPSPVRLGGGSSSTDHAPGSRAGTNYFARGIPIA